MEYNFMSLYTELNHLGYQGILFDLDGTLTDPKEGIIKSFQYAFNKIGLPEPSSKQLERFIGSPLQQAFSELLDPPHKHLIEQMIAYYRERYATFGMFENKPYEGVKEMLENLRNEGHRLFVATSKPTVFATKILIHFKLSEYFEEIFGSELDGSRSDKGDLLRYIKKTKSLGDRLLMVGDRNFDMNAARQNNLDFLGVTYGYGSHSELKEAGTRHLCQNPMEIYQWIKHKKMQLNFCLIYFVILMLTIGTNSAFANAPYFIFIAGGSAAGKTTFARHLVNKLGEEKALYISLDEYLDKRVQEESHYIDGIPNFDNPSMINWKLLLKNISALQKGLSIDTPVYDFSLWMPVAFRKLQWKPVVIIEGIHATQNPLDEILGLRIFLDVDSELRYQRRLARDVAERNYSLEMIKKIFFNMAIPFEKTFLVPTMHKANILFTNLDGEDYLKKALEYTVEIFETYKTVGYETIKRNISYEELN